MNFENKDQTSQILDSRELTSEERLQEESKEVTRYHEFITGNKKTYRETYSPTSGIIITILGTIDFLTFLIILSVIGSKEWNETTPVFFAICLANVILGLLILIIGGIVIHHQKKKQRKSDKEILITTDSEYRYATDKAEQRLETEYVDERIRLKNEKKDIISEPETEEEVVVYQKLVSPLADLEDEEEALGRNSSERHEVRNYDTFTLTSMDLLHRFSLLLLNKGLRLQDKEAENLLSHLSYSRVLLLKGIDGLNRLGFATALQDTFNESKAFFPFEKHLKSEETLIHDKSFLAALKFADEHPDDYAFFCINDIRSDEIRLLLADFLPALFDKNNRHKILTPYLDSAIPVPTNLYFLLFLNKVDTTGLYADDEVLRYCPILSLPLEKTTIEEQEIPVLRPLSISDYQQLLRFEKNQHCLSEDVWNRIDGLEEYVHHLVPTYHIDNDIANDIENHAGLYFGTSENQDEIIDEVLSCDLLPSILHLFPKERIEGADSLEDYIQEHFGQDYSLPMTEQLFKDYLYTIDHPLPEEEVEEETVEKEKEEVTEEETGNEETSEEAAEETTEENTEDTAEDAAEVPSETEEKVEEPSQQPVEEEQPQTKASSLLSQMSELVSNEEMTEETEIQEESNSSDVSDADTKNEETDL